MNNPVMEKLKEQSAVCPRCHAQMPPHDLPRREGEVDDAYCPACGWRGYVVVETCRVETFEWCFDNGARTVVWDVSKLREFLLGQPHAPTHEIPWEVCKAWLEANDHAPDDTDRESLAGDTPIIVIEHPSALPPEWLPSGLLPIDGWHRMWDAVKAKRNLRAWVCRRALEEQYRVIDLIYLGHGGPIMEEWAGQIQTQMERWDEQAEEKTLLSTKR